MSPLPLAARKPLRRAVLALVGLALVVLAWDVDWCVSLGAGLLVSLPIVYFAEDRVRPSHLSWLFFALYGVALLTRVWWLGYASLGALGVTVVERSAEALGDRKRQ